MAFTLVKNSVCALGSEKQRLTTKFCALVVGGLGVEFHLSLGPEVGRRNEEKSGRSSVHKVWVLDYSGNDPSAGSPTETLLRLLLPLNDKVCATSRHVAAGEPAASRQSEELTGPFNR